MQRIDGLQPLLRSRRLVAAILVLAMVGDAHADWVWKNAEATAALTDDRFVAVFTYHNTGGKPVTVKELMFACSCTEHTFKAKAADAGGDGELRILLPPGANEATLELVAFGSEESTPVQLTIRFPGNRKPSP